MIRTLMTVSPAHVCLAAGVSTASGLINVNVLKTELDTDVNVSSSVCKVS